MPKMRKTYLGVMVTAGLLFSSGNALACCASGLIGQASGMKASIGGSLSAMQAAIALQLKMNGMDMVRGLEAVRKTTAKAVEANTDEAMMQQRLLEQQKALYATRKEIEDAYGAAPASVCIEAGQAATVAAADQSARKASSKAELKVKNRIRGYGANGKPIAPQEAVLDLVKTKPGELDVDRLADKSLSEKERQELLARLVDPRPPEPVNEKEAVKTPAGAVLVSAMRERESSMSGVKSVMKEVYDIRAPQGKGDKAQSVMETLDNAVGVGGWTNPEYHAELQRLGDVDAIREAVKQAAARNYILYRRLKLKLAKLKAKTLYYRDKLREQQDYRINALKRRYVAAGGQ